MSRIEKIFKDLDRPALITFITAGDPDYDTGLSVLKSLPGAGADIIELGMPFSDPMADGPVIQAAGQRALSAGAGMEKTLRMVSDFRQSNSKTPVVLMGYANPVFVYGAERFCADAQQVGVDGVIIVDLPPEEDSLLRSYAQTYGLDIIRLVTPTTDDSRLEKILEGAGGFLYYVTITGVTGTAKADIKSLAPHLEHIRKQTSLPIATGFGIQTPDDVSAFAGIADAVVVGSALVKNMAENVSADVLEENIKQQVQALAQALV